MLMYIQDIIDQIAAMALEKGASDLPFDTAVPGLSCLHVKKLTAIQAILYQPSLCLILQGAKETHMGDHRQFLSAGQAVIVSHMVPVVSQVVLASPSEPYVAVVLELDLALVRSLIDGVPQKGLSAEAQTVSAAPVDAALLDAMGRLFLLHNKPEERAVMAPLIKKEIHFRLLMAAHGGSLRALLDRSSHASRIASAIERIKRDFAQTLSVTNLAEVAGMSTSSFHVRFKAVTAKTPLQFQKDMRLMEAQRLLNAGGHNVSAAAFEVGYESPTQFSREYARKFGVSPKADRLAVPAP